MRSQDFRFAPNSVAKLSVVILFNSSSSVRGHCYSRCRLLPVRDWFARYLFSGFYAFIPANINGGGDLLAYRASFRRF